MAYIKKSAVFIFVILRVRVIKITGVASGVKQTLPHTNLNVDIEKENKMNATPQELILAVALIWMSMFMHVTLVAWGKWLNRYLSRPRTQETYNMTIEATDSTELEGLQLLVPPCDCADKKPRLAPLHHVGCPYGEFKGLSGGRAKPHSWDCACKGNPCVCPKSEPKCNCPIVDRMKGIHEPFCPSLLYRSEGSVLKCTCEAHKHAGIHAQNCDAYTHPSVRDVKKGDQL
jgi:hypothetical protein